MVFYGTEGCVGWLFRVILQQGLTQVGGFDTIAVRWVLVPPSWEICQSWEICLRWEGN